MSLHTIRKIAHADRFGLAWWHLDMLPPNLPPQDTRRALTFVEPAPRQWRGTLHENADLLRDAFERRALTASPACSWSRWTEDVPGWETRFGHLSGSVSRSRVESTPLVVWCRNTENTVTSHMTAREPTLKLLPVRLTEAFV